MEEDDMVEQVQQYPKYKNKLIGEEGGYRPEELIRGGQGLAEGQPWQPLRALGTQPSKGPKVPLHCPPPWLGLAPSPYPKCIDFYVQKNEQR